MRGVFFGSYLAIFSFLQWNCAHAFVSTLGTKLMTMAKLNKPIRSIVIDAGSSGSRICAYSFVVSGDKNSLRLAQEFNHEVTPGLSSFANNPLQASKSISELLEKIKNEIPSDEWSSTSIMLLATAGLRIVPSKKSQKILEVAEDTLRDSGFRVSSKPAYIITGTEEGLLSWFSINLLLGKLNGQSSVAVLDMGGASTQVTFVPHDVNLSQDMYMTKLVLYQHNYPVFTRSYLGLGLNEARKLILQYGKSHGATIFYSSCMSPEIKTNWTFRGVNYNVEGAYGYNNLNEIPQGVNFAECEKEVRGAVFKQVNGEYPPSLRGQKIYAISGFFYRAVDSGLLNKNQRRGRATFQQFIYKTHEKCRNEDLDQPFLCLDMTYLMVLLRDIYDVGLQDKIHFAKYLRGHKVGWTLGAAFLNVNDQMMHSNM